MAEQIIKVSDLSGQRIENPDEQLVDMVVTDHPTFEAGQQARLEALPDEVKDLGEHAIDAVGLLVTMPGEDAPTRYILPQDKFNELATARPMEEVLAAAALVKAVAVRRSHNRTTNGEPLRGFDTLETAGEPHKGKVGAVEAELVRTNLEAINERLKIQGYPTIDPANPEHAKRYGFDTPTPVASAEDTAAGSAEPDGSNDKAAPEGERTETATDGTVTRIGTRRGRGKS